MFTLILLSCISVNAATYTVQIFALSSEYAADEVVSFLKSIDYPAYYYPATVNGKDYWRVCLDKKNSRKDLKFIQEKYHEKFPNADKSFISKLK